jgi:hypothetical protein
MPEPLVIARRDRPRRPRRRRSVARRRARLVLALAVVAAIVLGLLLALGGGGIKKPPAGGVATVGHSADPFSYATSQAAQFTARATAGNARPLFSQSPGGALATARRVAAWRPDIDRAVQGTPISASLLEGLVFVESAGRPQIIAGRSVTDAAGLTQILASTASSMLGEQINTARSQQLTDRIDAVADGSQKGDLAKLVRERAAVDPRVDPVKELTATVRYLETSEQRFGREDLAFESYHMGIGNLTDVLHAYDGGTPVPYVQLYFDSTPTRHAASFKLLASFQDESSLYWWRILGAVQIMKLYRGDRAALKRLSTLELADDAGGSVLHPPGRPKRFATPQALSAAYQARTVLPLPRNAGQLGLAYDASMGSGAAAVSAPRSLYRGLTPVAQHLLIELADQVRRLSGGETPLHVGSTVTDGRFDAARGAFDPMAETGDAFAIDRRYRSQHQAGAFQDLLDRLQSLNLIAWVADGDHIDITVASDASRWRG